MADYVLDLFVAEDYIADDYVSDPYVNAQYVGGVVQEATASLNASASAVFDVERIRPFSAELAANTQTSTDGLRVRLGTSTFGANATTTASAIATKVGTSTASSSVVTQTQGSAIKQGIVQTDSAMSSSVSAVATVSPGADILLTASVSAIGSSQFQGTVDMTHAGDEVTWDEAGTWGYPFSEVWGPLFDVRATAIIGNNLSYDLQTSATVVVDGDKTQRATIQADNFATFAVDATKVVSADTTLDAVASIVDAFATSSRETSATLNSTITLDSSAIFSVIGRSTLNATATVDTEGERSRSGQTTLQAQATQTLTGNEFAIRNAVADTETTATLDTVAGPLRSGTVTAQTVAQLQSDAERIQGIFQENLISQATISVNAGVLSSAVANLNAFNTVVSVLTIYNIDPYRIYPVKSEVRSLVVPLESRNYTVKSENRVNKVEAENRTIEIPSETRSLVVQHTKLVELAGTLDRREG